MPGRRVLENREPVVRHLLVFHRAADDDVRVSFPPIRRERLRKPVDALGNEQEPKIRPFPHHRPGFRPPRVRIRQEEIRCEAGIYHRPRHELVPAAARMAQGQRKVARLFHDGRIPLMPRIYAVYITILAAG